MANDDSKMTHGDVSWIEIPVKDVARARAFYTEVFGWNCPEKAIPVSDGGVKAMYFFNSASKKLDGAFVDLDDGLHLANYAADNKEALALLPTFDVQDCAHTLTEVVSKGGKIHHPKTDIGNGMGYYARFIDPEGNMVGIWSRN